MHITVKTFGLLQPYFGHLSCMPTHTVKKLAYFNHICRLSQLISDKNLEWLYNIKAVQDAEGSHVAH